MNVTSPPSIAAPEEPVAPVSGEVDAMYAASYRELRRLAHARLRTGGRNTVLDTTALVHESYLRLAQGNGSAMAFTDKLRFMA